MTDAVDRVKLGAIRSEWSKMSRGCPQGSSFGPLLWNVFQNDMAMLVKDTNLFIYADDHQLIQPRSQGPPFYRPLEREKRDPGTRWSCVSQNLGDDN